MANRGAVNVKLEDMTQYATVIPDPASPAPGKTLSGQYYCILDISGCISFHRSSFLEKDTPGKNTEGLDKNSFTNENVAFLR